MTQRNVIIEDNAITDEKTLLIKLEEEKKTVEKLNEHLVQKQEEKKALTSKLRNFTHKIKDLEEAVTVNSMELEKLKMEREKFISKIDRKEINQKIDNKCELVFQDLLEQVDPQNMEIEVRFEGTSTHFRVTDNVGNPQETLKTDEPIFTKPIRKDSLTKRTSQTLLQTKHQTPTVKPKTFADLKLSVAPFFSLNPDDFFFADEQNAIFLDNLPIRQTLMPYGLKIKNTLPFLTIVLANHYKFDEIINEKIMKEAEHYSSDNKKNKEESREMVELELARKQAEETRIKSEEYQNSRVKIQKIKGVLNSIIFLVVIALYIFNLFQRFSFEKIYTMQNAIESALNDESYASLDQQTFYTLLISGMESSSAATTTQYGSFEIYFLSLINPIAFFKLNYILKHITLVMTRYDAVSCVAESTYTTTYNVKCLDPNRMNEAPYTTSNGVTYNYIHNPPDSVSLDVPLGHFDNSGYRLDVELSLDTTTYTNYYNKIVDFADYTRGKYISFNFVVYNPSLEKMACVYRIFIHYNEDIYYFQNFVYVFNTEDRTTSEIVSADFLLALASILILSSVLELFHVIHESKEEFDLELYFRDLKRKKGMTTLSKEDEDFILKNKFWTFRSFGYIFKFYPPGFTYLLNLLTVVLILVSGALDLSLNNQINESGYLDNSEVNCAPLIKSNFANSIISSILILLLVLVLLKYISLFVPFLARFVRIIQSLISNVYTIGIIILAMILILTVFATYTFRPYFLDFTEFQQFYIALILMILKRNLIFLNGTADAEYDQMGHNIGTYAFVILILFLYVMLGLLIFKVITSIVIKSMKETQIDMKNEVNMSKAIHEKALNVMKEKLYEDLKANLRKQKASNKK